MHLERLGARLGLSRFYAKDESRNPTWSYKDRLCAVAVSHAVATGARVITISSTGNHGASTAAYAARAGLPCVIFTLSARARDDEDAVCRPTAPPSSSARRRRRAGR